MKHIKIPKFTPDVYLLLYKLLNDVLFLLLIAFIGTILAEGILPGIITSHISLSRITIAVMSAMIAIVWIGNKYQISYERPAIRKNRLIPFLILTTFLLLGNSMLKFALWENLTITVGILFSLFLLSREIFELKK